MYSDTVFTIHSKTSTNNGRICIAQSTKNPDIRKVQLVVFKENHFVPVEKPFYLSVNSLLPASIYDIVRNMNDQQLKQIIPPYIQSKIQKALHAN